MGLVFAFIFLELFDSYGPQVLPEVFVDRKIPIKVNFRALILSFIVPALMSLIFSFLTFRVNIKDNNYIELLRS